MNILLSGVGGQGILFVSRVLTELALVKDWCIVGAETHGMAQRGGSVVTHLRMDQTDAAPMIRKGRADLVLGLEEHEGLRYLGFLRRGGRLLIDAGSGKLHEPLVQAYLKAHGIEARSVPGSQRAREMGYPVGANLIMLAAGHRLGWLPFSQDEMTQVVARLSRPDLKALNLESLRCGWEALASTGRREGRR